METQWYLHLPMRVRSRSLAYASIPVLPLVLPDGRLTLCSLSMQWRGLGQEPSGGWLQRPQRRQERSGGPLQARPISRYFLWSCLTDAVRRRAASSRTVRGTVTSKTHFKILPPLYRYDRRAGARHATQLHHLIGAPCRFAAA